MPSTTIRLPSRPSPPRRRKRNRRTGTIVVLVLACAGGAAAWAWWNGTVGPVTVREHCTATANGNTTELDPEQAGNAAIITNIAVQRGLPARAASIGIATAIQESKLRNISYGDRDSLGLFQQRPSQGWGTEKEILDPVYAANAFYDELAKVEGFQDMPITEVAQKVQNSAFPNAYADHEPEARIMASALAGFSPGGFNCVLRQPKLAAESPGSTGLTTRATAVRTAAKRETGQETAVSGNSGRTLRYSVSTPKPPEGTKPDVTRSSWMLAQWAVARAENLGVTSVKVAGKQWQRDSSTDGWTTSSNPVAGGTVEITVA